MKSRKDDRNFGLADELSLLEEIWMEKLQSIERGYNTDAHVQQS